MFEVSVLTGKSGNKSMIMPLDDLFPDCRNLTKDTNLSRLSCWTQPGSCHKGSFTGCMASLVERAYRIFTAMPELELMVLHWQASHGSAPGQQRRWGLVIDRDENKEMRISPLNKWAVYNIENRIGKKFTIKMDL